MLSIGDTVIFKHSVCTVASKRENYFEGKDYWELHALFERSLKLFVACEMAKPPVLRAVMGKQEALDLIDSIADADVAEVGGIKAKDGSTTSLLQRHVKETYDAYLKSLSPKDLVPIIKTCHERSLAREDAGHKPTAVDRKYLDLAENLLCDELSVSLDMPRDDVRDFMLDRIKRAELAEA